MRGITLRLCIVHALTIQFCNIHARKMSSKSVKRLYIIDCCSLPDIMRLRICAPSLISLQLEDFEGLTPFLENMPLLQTTHVNLDDGCHDHCRSNRGVCDNFVCGCHTYPVKEGVLLNGLSNAAKLDLIALPKMFLYRWDLKWSPVFGKLKTLLLNKWFTAIDLVCILQHSPVLEMLTLRFDNTKVDSAYFVTKLASRRIHVRTQIIRLLIVTPLIATKMFGRS
ncbi:uncharacterized protein [Triticum aestivum]|uniref:uncharacterized protein isoform X2 n=1 Tax=Triticum aestivum TaxID=4565 RepID=UPI001D0046EB|nr:uncharacterized protein LOC123128847 isoform X2 [Triticum aestivum]